MTQESATMTPIQKARAALAAKRAAAKTAAVITPADAPVDASVDAPAVATVEEPPRKDRGIRETGMSRRNAERIVEATTGQRKFLNGNTGRLYWSDYPDDHDLDDPEGGPFYERPAQALLPIHAGLGYLMMPADLIPAEDHAYFMARRAKWLAFGGQEAMT